jgi:drug/metabolite transporter (DMT)-like permease
MSLKEFGVLLALGAIWGASFMFIKVGGREIGPFAMVEMRIGIAGIIMLLISFTRPGVVKAMLSNWRPLAVMGLINCALPYTLFVWGELYIDSGLAGIYNAFAPLWAAGLTFVLPFTERLTSSKVAGLIVGLGGVILLVGGNFAAGNGGGVLNLLGQGACLLAALSYGLAGHFGRRFLQGVPLQAAATGQLVTGTIMLAPLAAFQIPTTMPSWEALGSVAVLAIAGTALASLMYYWLLSRLGATKVLLVTYLLPGFALVWGALLLQEAITLTALLGLGLILLGIAITSGSLVGLFARFRRKPGEMTA